MNSPYLEFLFTIYSKRKRYAANVIRDNDNRINGKPSIFFFGNMTLDFDGSKRWKAGAFLKESRFASSPRVGRKT